MSSTDPALKTWGNHVTTHEGSISGPSLVFASGKLFVAWAGDNEGHSINIASTTDGGSSWHRKHTYSESTDVRPGLAFNATTNALVLSWAGRGNSELNFMEITDLEGLTPGNKTSISSQKTGTGFNVAYDAEGLPVVAFKGTDPNGWLNTATSEAASVSGFAASATRWRWLFDDNQSSDHGPTVASFKGGVFVAWENGQAINVAVLRRGSVCVYGLIEREAPERQVALLQPPLASPQNDVEAENIANAEGSGAKRSVPGWVKKYLLCGLAG
jgi:hypothetical protein